MKIGLISPIGVFETSLIFLKLTNTSGLGLALDH